MVINLSELEKPSAGEAYVRPLVCLGNNDITSPGPNQYPMTFAYPADDSPSMPVSPLQISFEGKPDQTARSRRSAELEKLFGKGEKLKR